MKFLKWLFGYVAKYNRDFKKYRRTSLAGKITLLVLMFVFAGATITCGYFAITSFNTSFVQGLLLTIFYVGALYATFENCIIYSIIGFRNALTSVVEEKATEKLNNAIEKSVGEEVGIDLKDEKFEERNQYKVFDIIMAICNLLIIASLIGTCIYFVVSNLPK